MEKIKTFKLGALIALALSIPFSAYAAQPAVTVQTSAVSSAPLQSQKANFQIHITGPGTAPVLVLQKQQSLFAASITVQNAQPGAKYNGSGADSPRRTLVVPTSSPAGYSIVNRIDPNSDIMQVSCAEGGVVTLRFWFKTGDKAHDYADTILVTATTQNPTDCAIGGQVAYIMQ